MIKPLRVDIPSQQELVDKLPQRRTYEHEKRVNMAAARIARALDMRFNGGPIDVLMEMDQATLEDILGDLIPPFREKGWDLGPIQKTPRGLSLTVHPI